MKTLTGTDYSRPTDLSIDSNKLCNNDERSISDAIKQELDTTPSNVFPPQNRPNDIISPSEVPVVILSPIDAPISPTKFSPASNSVPNHPSLLGNLTVTPNRDMNAYWNEIHTPVDFVFENSSTVIDTSIRDDSSVAKCIIPVHDAQTSKPHSTPSSSEHSQSEKTKLENMINNSNPDQSSKTKSKQTVSFNEVD